MLIAAITLLLAGAALLTRGLIGRRIGQEPRCRKCKYNLTGVESKQCPECGRPWKIESTPKGLRSKRMRPIAWGLVLAFASAAGFTWTALPAIRNINCYPYFPFDWLVAAAEKDKPAAATELQSRLKKGKRSAQDLRLVADAALRYQAKVPFGPNLSFWMLALHSAETMNAMGPVQREAYMEEIQSFELRIPKRRRQGEVLPVQISFSSSPNLLKDQTAGTPFASTRNWFFNVESARVVIRGLDDGRSSFGDEVTADLEPSPLDHSVDYGFPVRAPLKLDTETLVAGIHRITLQLEYSVFRSDSEYGPTAFSPWSRKVVVNGKVQIDPPDSAPSITPISDPETIQRLRSRIRVYQGRRDSGAPSDPPCWRLTTTYPLPCALSGDIYIRSADSELRLSKLYFTLASMPRGCRGSSELDAEIGPDAAELIDKVQRFSVEFRGRPERALEDPELDELFSTDLILATFERSADSPTGWRCIDCAPPPPPPALPVLVPGQKATLQNDSGSSGKTLLFGRASEVPANR